MTVLIRKIRLKENVNNNKKYLFDHFRETVKILTKRYEQAPKNFYINDKGYNAAILYFFLMFHKGYPRQSYPGRAPLDHDFLNQKKGAIFGVHF